MIVWRSRASTRRGTCPRLGNPEGELLDNVAAALGGDRNARLTKRLVFDEQLATNVNVGNPQSEIAGQFRIVVTAKPDADLKKIEAIIDEEVNRLIANGPTQAEIDKNIVQTVSGVIAGLESTSSKAGQLAQWEMIEGDPNGWKTSLKRVEASTPAAVQAAARKWLTRGSHTLTVLPFGSPKAFSAPVDRAKMPVPTSVADAVFPSYQTATLSNGMKIYLVERHDVPQVSVSMQINTGYPADTSKLKDGLSGLTASLLDEGTTTRSALQIADEVDKLGAYLGVGGGGEESAVEFTALTPTLDQVMAIWADVLRNPAFKEGDFKRVQAQTLQGLNQQLRDPNAIAQRVMAKALWSDNHPDGHLLSPDEISALTPADTAAFHKGWYGPNNATLFVVGDTTLAEITPKLEAALKGWENAPNTRADVPLGVRSTKPVVYLVDRPDSAQSIIMVGSTQPPRDPALDTRTSAFNALFGGNFTSRVNMNLREDKGWSYGARSGISGGRGPRSFIAHCAGADRRHQRRADRAAQGTDRCGGPQAAVSGGTGDGAHQHAAGHGEPVGDSGRRAGHADGYRRVQAAGGLLGEVRRQLSRGNAGAGRGDGQDDHPEPEPCLGHRRRSRQDREGYPRTQHRRGADRGCEWRPGGVGRRSASPGPHGSTGTASRLLTMRTWAHAGERYAG